MLPDELEARLTSYQIQELMAFETVEPSVDFYWCFSMLAMLIAQSGGARHAKQKNFYPKIKGRPQSLEEQLGILSAIAVRAPT